MKRNIISINVEMQLYHSGISDFIISPLCATSNFSDTAEECCRQNFISSFFFSQNQHHRTMMLGFMSTQGPVKLDKYVQLCRMSILCNTGCSQFLWTVYIHVTDIFYFYSGLETWLMWKEVLKY